MLNTMLSADATLNGSESIAFVALMIAVVVIIGGFILAFVELRKAKIRADQESQLRQLVDRYERLAENSLDAQQRAAADLAELRARVAAVEQLLRAV
jgi:anti-sigma-K factor RskA